MYYQYPVLSCFVGQGIYRPVANNAVNNIDIWRVRYPCSLVCVTMAWSLWRNRLTIVTSSQKINRASETRGRWVKIVVFNVICVFVMLCTKWNNVCTQVANCLCAHQNNPLVSAYIILYDLHMAFGWKYYKLSQKMYKKLSFTMYKFHFHHKNCRSKAQVLCDNSGKLGKSNNTVTQIWLPKQGKVALDGPHVVPMNFAIWAVTPKSHFLWVTERPISLNTLWR